MWVTRVQISPLSFWGTTRTGQEETRKPMPWRLGEPRLLLTSWGRSLGGLRTTAPSPSALTHWGWPSWAKPRLRASAGLSAKVCRCSSYRANPKGAPRSIVAIREDAAFRTNLILSNATGILVDVDVNLIAENGSTLGTKRYTLPPLGMTQVTKVVRDIGVSSNVIGARLALSTATSGGAFSAYASVIDNVTERSSHLVAQSCADPI